MTYLLSDAGQWENLLSRLNSLHERGAWVEVTEKTARTNSQNRYLHAAIGYLGAQLGYTKDYVKQHFFKEAANAELFKVTRTNRDGKKYTDLRSAADLTKEEMSTAIERFRHWSAQKAGVYIPSSEDWQAVLMMEQIVKRNQDLL